MYEIFIIYLVSFFGILAILGFGFFLNNFKFINIGSNVGYIGILGIFFLVIYSVITSFFYAHGIIHNSILFLIGIVLLAINIKKIKNKKLYLLLFFLHLFLFIGLLIYKTHDDFNYYHFEYSYLLSQYKKFFGIGNFDLGFRTPSTIFFLNSIFYLPKILYHSYHIPAFIIIFFSNLVLIEKIKFYFNKKKISIFYFFLIFSLLFTNIFFYRISEHGTDRSAQILVLLLFSEILFFLEKEKFEIINLKSISRMMILITLIIGFKAFYVLYFFISLAILLKLIKNYNFKKIISFFFKNIFFYLLVIKILILALINFYDSGCLLYPLYYTCFENFSWSVQINEVKDLNNWYELWSKGGATPNSRVSDPIQYISGLNWLSNWISVYFFNKVSDFLLSIFLLVSIVLITFKKHIFFRKEKIKLEIIFFLFLIIILIIEWFMQHPSLRYGGYCLIATIFFIIPCIIFKINKINEFDFKIKTISLIIVSLIIFNSRNIVRIIKENNQYGYRPLYNAFYNIEKNNFIHTNNFMCQKEKKNNCSTKEISIIKKFNNYYVITKKNN